MCRSLVCVACWALLSSCAVSSRAYVHSQVGFEVREGQVVGVEGLSAGRREQLGDGMVVHVEEPGCVVVLRRPEGASSLQLESGSRIVLGGGHDWVLVAPARESAATRAVRESVEVELAFAEGSLWEKVALADWALDLIEAGNIPAARDAIDRLGEGDEARAAQMALRALVESRIERVSPKLPDAAIYPLEPARAAQVQRLFDQASAWLSDGERLEALGLLEQAYELDAHDPKVTGELVSLLEQLGLEAYSNGRALEATELWQRGLALHPGDPELQRFLERAHRVEDGADPGPE